MPNPTNPKIIHIDDLSEKSAKQDAEKAVAATRLPLPSVTNCSS
jgi:hypothetical protein